MMHIANLSKKTISCGAVLAVGSVLGSIAFAKELPRQGEQRETEAPSASSTVQAGCGDEMEFDRDSGRMVRKNRVDLIVTQVELKRGTGEKVAIQPTVKNRCPGRITTDVSVAIDDVVVSVGRPSPNTPATTSWIVLGTKPSYSVTVDYSNQVREVNERNNGCVATFPSSMTAKTHKCL
jgi:hypothetical protein